MRVIISKQLLNLVQGVEEPPCGDGRPHTGKAKDIPAEHVPPGSVGTLDAKGYGFRLQFLGYPGHPDERIDKEGGDAEKIRHPVALRPTAKYLIQLILKPTQRHVQQEEESRREEVYKPEPEARPIRMFEPHGAKIGILRDYLALDLIYLRSSCMTDDKLQRSRQDSQNDASYFLNMTIRMVEGWNGTPKA